MKVSDFITKDIKTEYFVYDGIQPMLFSVRDDGNVRELWFEFSDRGFSDFIIGVQDYSFDFKQYVIDNIFEIFTEYVDMLRILEDCNDV